MASRLIVKAMSHRQIPNRLKSDLVQLLTKAGEDLAFVEVSVTSVFGVPKTKLTSSNFEISLIAAPGPQVTEANLQVVIEEKLPGFYALFIFGNAPLLNWPEGHYIFALTVHAETAKSVAQGQTLVSFTA